MPSEEEHKDDDSFSGSGLDEPIELDEATGNELDEPTDNELHEPTGNELDEPTISKIDELTGSELDEPTGNELDERNLDDEIDESIPQANVIPGAEKRSWKKRWLLLFAIPLIFILMGIPYFYYNQQQDPLGNTPRVYQIVLPEQQSFALGSFIIPFHKGKGSVFASLTLTLFFQGEDLKKEMHEKQYRLRDTIYDVLGAEMERRGNIPPFEKLKAIVLKETMSIISHGRIDDVEVDELSVL